jgi:hypothetical protein
VPEALAYATIAGVSPVVGLYAAPAALIFFAAFGSSRHLVTGPMAATAALSAAPVADLATGGSDRFVALTATLGLVVGVIALLAGLLRLGFVASFISEPVLKGFIVGLALTIIVGQVPKLLGISKGEGNFFEQLWHVLTHLGGTSGLTLLVGAFVAGDCAGAAAVGDSRDRSLHRRERRAHARPAGRRPGASAPTPPSGRRSRPSRPRTHAPPDATSGGRTGRGGGQEPRISDRPGHPLIRGTTRRGSAAGGRTSGAGNDRRRPGLHTASPSMRGR